MLQIKAVFLITIGILNLGESLQAEKSPASLIILHLDLSCVLQRKVVPLLSLAEQSPELALLAYLLDLLW